MQDTRQLDRYACRRDRGNPPVARLVSADAGDEAGNGERLGVLTGHSIARCPRRMSSPSQWFSLHQVQGSFRMADLADRPDLEMAAEGLLEGILGVIRENVLP